MFAYQILRVTFWFKFDLLCTHTVFVIILNYDFNVMSHFLSLKAFLPCPSTLSLLNFLLSVCLNEIYTSWPWIFFKANIIIVWSRKKQTANQPFETWSGVTFLVLLSDSLWKYLYLLILRKLAQFLSKIWGKGQWWWENVSRIAKINKE